MCNIFKVEKRGELCGDVEFYCDLTQEMNKYLVKEWEVSLNDGWIGKGTYALDYGTKENGLIHIYSIRFPGATRGHFYTDNNGIVTEVEFYEDTCYGRVRCYKNSLEEIKNIFIGWKLDLNNIK